MDAARDDNDKPVIVEFELLHAKRESIPDVDDLQNAIKKCYESNKDEPDAYNFFKKAYETLAQSHVNVLRISDYNTRGLEGSDTCEKGTNWSRLVKESGSSNKGKSSGGSFGIGKSATFACSDLRTVLYSSLDINGLKSNFGVARLISFDDEELGWTTGVGYYSEDNRFIAIPGLISLDENYQRLESGTDIYILGMCMSENPEKEFIEAVLMNFLVSLIKGKLVVNVQGNTISKDSLAEYIARLNLYQSEDIKALITGQNIMRRIIENYFGMLGRGKEAFIEAKFDSPEDAMICKSLFYWINDGSHMITDDLFIDPYTDSIERYKEIFKQIFVKTGNEAHYNMMMKVK